MQKNNKTTILLVSIILILLCFSLSATYATNHVTNDSINTNNNEEGFVKSISDDTKPKHDSKNIETNNDKIDEEFLCSTTTISSFKDKEERKLKSNTDKFINSDEDLQNNNNADDDVVNSVYYINSSNLDSYFDYRGLLKKEFTDSILVFTGEFRDKGILTITQPNTIIGNYALFNNTAFCIESPNTLLSNLNFILTEEFYDNDYAGILVLNDNATIYNCTIDYIVPENTCGACVYVECGSYMKLNGLNLINNTFNIIGNNIEEGFAYGVYMEWVNNPVIYGNRINAELPLKAVDWSQEIYGGARMDTVGAFLADTCENLTLTNNHITTKATYRGNKFPTLDTVLIYACNNSVIENNRIYSEDYYTKEDQDNYLQGIDLYISNNVTIIGNQIDIRTTGGSENMGTAYPIQVTGPSRDVKIVYNKISSVNNGPNIGVYSQNFYGATQINIISNFINITGKANKHNWALVTGIEVQDSDDIIMNNTIIVTNKNAYNDDYNVYGISYSQNTNNNHTYNIQYNTVTTNGRYAVLLVGSNSLVVNSIIANNILNTLVNSGDDAVFIGSGTNNLVENNNGETTKTYSNEDLPDWLKNHKTIKPEVKLPHVKLPPLPEPIIKPQHTNPNSNGSGLTNTQGNGMMPWNKNGTSNGLNNNATPTNPQNKNTPNKNSVVSNGTDPNSNHIKGSHDISLKIGGKSISRQSTAASPGESGSSAANNNKIYEVKEKTKKLIKENNNISGIIIAAIVLLLIFAGYTRKNKEQEE